MDWYEPKCCSRQDDEQDVDESLDSYYAKFLNEESIRPSQRKKCCQKEVRQILGAIFCLGFGVIWYIFRMDYEVL